MTTSPLLHDVPAVAMPTPTPGPLLVVDLLQDVDRLAGHLQNELARRSWLNAYLLAAGINQIAEDHIAGDGHLLSKAADHIAGAPAPFGLLGERTLRATASAQAAMRSLSPAGRRVSAWQADVTSLVAQLADIVITGDPSDSHRRTIELLGRQVAEGCPGLPPTLRQSIIRPPSCFRSFDQRPEDMQSLVRKLTLQGIASTTPVAVIGVRTSGSYLGPLVAASLRKEGFHDVLARTLRPGHPVAARDRPAVLDVAARGGVVLLVDDPPTTGGSLDMAARDLERLGVAPATIVMLVPLLSSADSLPEKILHHPHVLLPWSEWSIHDQLGSENIRASLNRLVGSRFSVADARRLGTRDRSGERGHVEGRFWVRLRDLHNDVESWRVVHVAGVGLGYLGEHALAVAGRLTGFIPEVYGVDNGLLFRSWLPSERRRLPDPTDLDSRHLQPFLDYIQARATALAVVRDSSQRLRGRLPVWEAASNILSRAFGRGWAWARIPLVDPVVKSILAVDSPAVVDGSMGIGNWFAADGPANGLVKVDFDRRAFSNLDLCSYDVVFDVASLAADLELEANRAVGTPPPPDCLRDMWAEMTGDSISPERWFLLQVVHLWDRQRTESGREVELSRALARASQRYFAELFFAQARSSSRGPFCAVDIDGVLETEGFGFSSLTTSSAVALSALLAHDFRPLLVTGRSLEEVRSRCSAFGLSGGVAEYGSVFYDSEHGVVRSLVVDDQLADLRRLGEAFGAIEGIRVDDGFQHSVRVYQRGSRGERRPPPADIVDRILAELGLTDSIVLHAGDGQTDFVAAGIDKGNGLSALLAHLGVDPEALECQPVALAVGDGAADIAMFPLAHLVAVPAHAPADVRRAANRTLSRPYQAGFADAVAVLLGHRPGSCSVCAAPTLESVSRAVLLMLSAHERGSRSMVAAAISMALSGGRQRAGMSGLHRTIAVKDQDPIRW